MHKKKRGLNIILRKGVFMYNVYVVLTRTNTVMSKIIRLGTGHSYNHVSLSLEDNLNELYSFGRRGMYNPFNGGFVTESFKRGILASQKTTCKVYKSYIDEVQYESLKNDLNKFKIDKNYYGYNYIGAILLRFNLKREHRSKYFCSQFVASVLDKYSVLEFNKNPNLYFPEDFEKHGELMFVYEGSAEVYRSKGVS
jgi:hypothetical protein